MATIFLAIMTDHEKIWKKHKWKWMVLGALGCVNNTDFENTKNNDNILLDVFIICQKLPHV